jgi:hypothetical protein
MSVLVETTPCRIRLRREKGWRLAEATNNPNGVVKVDRTTRWGNPFVVVPVPRTDAGLACLADSDRHVVCDRAVAVHLFEEDLEAGLLPYTVEDVRRELSGKDLACWCLVGTPCHADVLIELANADQAVTA